MTNTPDEIVRTARVHLEAYALKIVKQTWLMLGQTPTSQRTAQAKLRIESELQPFLIETAKWVLDCEEDRSAK